MAIKAIKLLLLPFLAIALACPAQKLAIVGGTLIDLSNFGRSANDVVDTVVRKSGRLEIRCYIEHIPGCLEQSIS